MILKNKDIMEGKKSATKSIKERYEYHVDEITDIIRSNGVLFDSCNILDDYGWDIEHGKITWLSKHAYDEISIAYANCIQYLKDEYNGKKKDELIDDLTKFFDKVISLTESNKSVKKSLKEGIDVKIVYADDTPSEYIDDVTHNDILDIIEESPEVYKIFDISGSKKKLVWSDEYGFERAYESRKSCKKSINEGIQKKDWKDWEIDDFALGTYFFNGNKVNERDVQNLINEDYDDISVNYVEINKLLDKMFVGKTLGDLANQEYAMIFGKDVDLALWFDLTLEELKSVQNGKYGFVTVHATFSIPSTHEIYSFGLSGYVGVNIEYGSMFLESKKFVRKSLKEGINDELIATSSDAKANLYLSDERQANHGKDPHYEFSLAENGYFTEYVRCDDEDCEKVVLDWIKEFDFDISKAEILKMIKLYELKKFTRKSLKEQFVGKGEGGYRKPRANKNNSGVCKDSNGVNHKVIFDTHVEDFIVWVDNDNYLMWDIYSAGGLKRNLLKSDLDEKLIDEIAELGKQLIYGFDTDF